MKRKFSASSIMSLLVKIAFNNIEYFRENSTHLGWLMANFQIVSLEQNDNPKYYILDYKAPKDDINFVYAAWAITITGQIVSCIDPIYQPHIKQKMTLDEIIQVILDPNYKYHNIYKTRLKIVDSLFMVIGNEFKWHEGYITPMAHSSYPYYMFIGYTVCENEIDVFIKEKIKNTIGSNSHIEKLVQHQWAKIHKFNKLSVEDQECIEYAYFMENLHENKINEIKKAISLLNIKKKNDDDENALNYYGLIEGFSNICKIPKNANNSFVIEARNILQQILLKKCTLNKKPPSDEDILLAKNILLHINKYHAN